MNIKVNLKEQDGIRVPIVPDWAHSWRVIEDHGDGTITVEIERDPEQQITEMQAIIDQLLIDALERQS